MRGESRIRDLGNGHSLVTGKFANAAVTFLTGPCHSKLQYGLAKQKPIIPGDVWLCYFQKTSVRAATRVRWAMDSREK